MNELDEIKIRTDIVDLVGGYVQLKKAGRNYKGLCPFHNEKTPSFMVSPEKQIWHCFGACNEGGDVFSFIQKTEGLSFGEAIKKLADKTGVKIEGKKYQENKPKTSLYSANEIAMEFFIKALELPEGKKAKDYLLKNRAISTKTVKDFSIGYAPKGKDNLKKELLLHKIKTEDMLIAGLIKEKDNELLDFFWQRLIFPIKDTSGNVIGFSARVLDDSLPKYINTKETPIYSKSKILYGIDLAKEAIRKQDYIILAEGMMDVISSYQSGVKNIVATGGTALTEDQLRLIQRFTKNIKLAFDVDFAGNEATRRAIELAWNMDFNIKVINIPDGKDPGDIATKRPEVWKEAVKNAVYVIDYLFENSLKKYNKKDPIGRKKIAKDLLPIIKRIPDKIEKDTYIKRLSNELLVDEASIIATLKNISLPKTKREKIAPTKINPEQMTEIEKNTLGLLSEQPQYLDFADTVLDPEDFSNKESGEFFQKMVKYYNKNKKFSESGFLESLKKDECEIFKHYILLAEVNFSELNEEKKAEEIYFGVKRIRKKSLNNKKKMIIEAIKTFEKTQDKKGATEALIKLNEIIIEEQKIS